ncbi:MAG TPA: DUF4349 domain-containing protein [Solirubrobacteraceae bacterium]|jgi:hypothetical protein|nr:DUF4349 domain-containing protein [Solirubrobacteraceae bacterium]
MPQLDHDPIDPEVAATLDAIDATLAGEPVDARYADIAEIALLLAADRPEVPPAFAQSLDQKLERRFARLDTSEKRPKRRRSWSGFWGAAGALGAGVAAIVAIVLVTGGGGGAPSESSSSAASSAASSSAGSSATGSRAAAAPAPRTEKHTAASTNGGVFAPTQTSASNAAQPLQPPTTGRKVVQGAQLNLGASPSRIDDVAQEIYNVIGQANGIVENSSVTQGGAAGYANFQLSVPSGSLGQTMTQLSSLTYAQVISRTDSTQDITDQYGAATRALADARALRTSLLKQLAAATTTEEIDSLKAQINDAEASISSDQATLNRLNHQVNYSEVYVTVQARTTPAPASHGGGGFTVGKAAHDAGRVLTVAAGVALIALAAITPVALVVALLWWVGSALKRRRREHALDSV